LRRAIDLNRRIRAAAAPYSRNSQNHVATDNVYEHRVPRQQSLYDWPPASDEEDEDETDPPSWTHPRDYSNRHPIPESTHTSWNRPARDDTSHPSQYSSDRPQAPGAFANQYTESSLATAALLQSVRRHPQFSRRTRNTLSNQIIDDYHAQQSRRPDSELERQRARFPRPGPPNRDTDRSMYPDRYHPTDYRSSTVQSASIQRHMDNRLRDVLRYLERVRFCLSFEDRLATAAHAGFARSDFFCKDTDDFLLNTTTLTPPRETSWLKNGCVFSGAQHASHGSLLHHSEWTSSIRLRENPNYGRVTNPTHNSIEASITVHTTSGRRYVARTPSISTPRTPLAGSSSVLDSLASERWPVRVTLHTIDYETMTVSGTMEAKSIPDKSSPTQESSITTFLEGEIIDFNRHTLETKSFKSDTDIDATYWSRLMPFREMSGETSWKSLLSKKWVSEKLQGKWVLMRWKGISN
jgi:hypothetical protein